MCPRYVRINTLRAALEVVQLQLAKEGWSPTNYVKDQISYDDFLQLVKVEYTCYFLLQGCEFNPGSRQLLGERGSALLSILAELYGL